ncbi:MAG: alpha/beta hydrolase [Armatimonadota bacterium]|nr:alpha/beta hydrolase [Armatimonadota bacterium]
MTGGFVHRFVPAAPDGPACTLVLLHGTGGDEGALIPLGQALLPGAALLSPRGKVLERGMPRFFRRLAEGVFDLEDLRARTEELAEFLTAAAASYALDPARLVAVGFSNGANIAASLLLLRPGVLAGAVLLRPMVPLVPERQPDLSGVPVLLAAGRGDSLVPPDHPDRLAQMLRAAGAEVTVHWEDGGHALAAGDVAAVRAWLAAATARGGTPGPRG